MLRFLLQMPIARRRGPRKEANVGLGLALGSVGGFRVPTIRLYLALAPFGRSQPLT